MTIVLRSATNNPTNVIANRILCKQRVCKPAQLPKAASVVPVIELFGAGGRLVTKVGMSALNLTAHPVVLSLRDKNFPPQKEKGFPLELQKPTFTIWLPQGISPFTQRWGEVGKHAV